MGPYHAARIGAHDNIVLLSRTTAAKLESKHRSRDLRLYRLAETIICEGEIFLDKPNTAVAVWRAPVGSDGKRECFKAVLKATKSGHEIYLTTVHRIEERGMTSIRRRSLKLGKGAM